jgi:hypothetical protein
MELGDQGDGEHDGQSAGPNGAWFGAVARSPDPELLTHPYAPHALNEAIVLYRGAYCLPPGDPDERAYDGVIGLTWLPQPEIEARGERTVTLPERWTHLAGRTAQASGGWTTISTVRLLAGAALPTMPPRPAGALNATASRSGAGEQLTTMIFPPEFGDGSTLTRVTGLVVNGFEAWDGEPVADPAGGRFPISARTVGRGGGWVARIDTVAQSGAGWKALETSRGYQVTQVLELARADGAEFGAHQAARALEVVGYALTIALGRHVSVSLPIGWRAREAVWTRWAVGRVDPFRDPGTWLDQSITSAQVGELIGRTLEAWDDELRRDTLRDALSYLVQSQAGQAELGITLPVSGLTLMSYSYLVEEVGVCSKRLWKELGVAGQIRKLITSLGVATDLAVPADLAHLEDLRGRISARSGEPVEDGLGCIIKMRNAIMHPKRGERADWTYEEIVEGYLYASHLFEMALLAYVGYRGKVHPRIASVRMVGYLEDVPWSTAEAVPAGRSVS